MRTKIYNVFKSVPFMGALLALFFFFGCKKDELVKFSTDLAVNGEIIRVADSAGKSRILVYAEKDWTVSTEENAPWLKFDKNAGSGNGEFIAIFDSNKDALPRAVNLIITASGKTSKISFQQRGLVPALNIIDVNANGIGAGGVMKTAITTNIPLEKMTQQTTYINGENWISNLQMKDGYLFFTLAQNPAATLRSAKLLLSYKDALGTTIKDSLIISQNTRGNYDNAVLKDFNYVKNSLASGAINEDIYIEGTIISDKGNPNMGLNPNKASNKHEIDKTENAITVYLQSPDGRSGFLIRTKTGGDNIFGKNEKVKIWLKGLTLRKETNPGRTIIENLVSQNVISKEEGAAVVPRALSMKELTDNDLYTLITLKDVEISVPSGSFFNINEGYTARMDAYPTNIRDKDGISMPMILNIDVPYRRDGKRVPQGSGAITGILVHEKLDRYGTNIGKYSIRPTKREDIALSEDRSSGFSNVLVEWSRFKTEFAAAPTAANNPLTPDIGQGTLAHSEVSGLNFTSTGVYTNPDYNGLIQEPTTIKGSVANGSWAAKNWWNNTKNIGASWNINISTAGITGPISLQFEGNGEIGGPRNFVVEWNSEGFAGPVWNQVGEFTFEDVANFSNTLLTQVAGFKVVNFQFPVQASGLENLYIRIRVKNKTVGTATSPTGGTLAAAGTSRLGHLSIKYNK